MKTVLRDISLSKKSLGSVRQGMGRNAVRPLSAPRLFSMNNFAARIAGKYLGTENYTGFFARMVLLLLKDGNGENAGRERHIHHNHFYYRYVRTVQMVYGSRAERIFWRDFGAGEGGTDNNYHVSPILPYAVSRFVHRISLALQNTMQNEPERSSTIIVSPQKVPAMLPAERFAESRKIEVHSAEVQSPAQESFSEVLENERTEIQSPMREISTELLENRKAKEQNPSQGNPTEFLKDRITATQSSAGEKFTEFLENRKTEIQNTVQNFSTVEGINRQYDTVSSHIWNMVVRQIHRVNRTFLRNFSTSQNAEKMVLQAGDINAVFKRNVDSQENLISVENNVSAIVNQKPLVVKQAFNKEQFADNRIFNTEQFTINQILNKNEGTSPTTLPRGDGFIEKQIVGNRISNGNIENNNLSISNLSFNGAEPTFNQIFNDERFAIWQMFGGKPSAINWIVNFAWQKQNTFTAFNISNNYPFLVNTITDNENRNFFNHLLMGFGSSLNRMTGESIKKSIFPMASSVRRLIFRQNVHRHSNQSILNNHFLPLNATNYSNLDISRNIFGAQTFPRNLTNISESSVAWVGDSSAPDKY